MIRRRYSDAEIDYYMGEFTFGPKEYSEVILNVERANGINDLAFNNFSHHDKKHKMNRVGSAAQYEFYKANLYGYAWQYEYEYKNYPEKEETIKGSCFYIRANGRDEREKLLNFLEDEGFQMENAIHLSKEGILESNYQITVHISDKKEYGMIGNTTCAAAAVSLTIDVEDFYKQYWRPKCTYEEYYEEVRKRFDYPEEEKEKYLAIMQTYIKNCYDIYITDRLGGEPDTVAKALKEIFNGLSKRSGFDAPAIGVVLSKDTVIRKNPDGTLHISNPGEE